MTFGIEYANLHTLAIKRSAFFAWNPLLFTDLLTHLSDYNQSVRNLRRSYEDEKNTNSLLDYHRVHPDRVLAQCRQ
ncbi:hypothetical protein D3C80_1645780 [compost metagenome]